MLRFVNLTSFLPLLSSGLWQLICGRCSSGLLSGVARFYYTGPVSLKVAGLRIPLGFRAKGCKIGGRHAELTLLEICSCQSCRHVRVCPMPSHVSVSWMTFRARAAFLWAELRSPDSCVRQHVHFCVVLCRTAGTLYSPSSLLIHLAGRLGLRYG